MGERVAVVLGSLTTDGVVVPLVVNRCCCCLENWAGFGARVASILTVLMAASIAWAGLAVVPIETAGSEWDKIVLWLLCCAWLISRDKFMVSGSLGPSWCCDSISGVCCCCTPGRLVVEVADSDDWLLRRFFSLFALNLAAKLPLKLPVVSLWAKAVDSSGSSGRFVVLVVVAVVVVVVVGAVIVVAAGSWLLIIWWLLNTKEPLWNGGMSMKPRELIFAPPLVCSTSLLLLLTPPTSALSECCNVLGLEKTLCNVVALCPCCIGSIGPNLFLRGSGSPCLLVGLRKLSNRSNALTMFGATRGLAVPTGP